MAHSITSLLPSLPFFSFLPFICIDCLFVFTDLTSGLFVQIAQEDTNPMQTAAPGSHQSLCFRNSRQKLLLRSLGGRPGTFGCLSGSCNLGGSLGLGLWLAAPETLGNVSRSTFPELEEGDVGNLTDTLWIPGLTCMGFTSSRQPQLVYSPPWRFDLHLLQAFLLQSLFLFLFLT